MNNSDVTEKLKAPATSIPASGWVFAIIMKTLAQYLGIFMAIMVKVQSDDHRIIPMFCAAFLSLLFLFYANTRMIPNVRDQRQ